MMRLIGCGYKMVTLVRSGGILSGGDQEKGRAEGCQVQGWSEVRTKKKKQETEASGSRLNALFVRHTLTSRV